MEWICVPRRQSEQLRETRKDVLKVRPSSLASFAQDSTYKCLNGIVTLTTVLNTMHACSSATYSSSCASSWALQIKWSLCGNLCLHPHLPCNQIIILATGQRIFSRTDVQCCRRREQSTRESFPSSSIKRSVYWGHQIVSGSPQLRATFWMSGKVKSGSLYYTPTSFRNYVRLEFASIMNQTLIRLKLFLFSFSPEEKETFIVFQSVASRSL